MLELRKGIDILTELGGVKTTAAAEALIAERFDRESRVKLGRLSNKEVLLKIANTISLCRPERIFINTGSDDDRSAIREHSLLKGEERKLALKDHTIHFDLPQEQARIVKRTLYIINDEEKTSLLARTILRQEAFQYIRKYLTGIMEGKTLYVGFYSRGPIGARASIPAMEITSSTYVTHSADILYRNAYQRFDEEVDRVGYFFTNVHSEGPNRPEDLINARVFMDRSWLTTFSMFCTYAGNTLLMKKGNHRFAVDLATYLKPEEELSEHMFITGLKGPGGRKTFFAGAAPSGCGKTTTAMVGDEFIGDDLAQLWIAEDGTLRGINPEKGIFGIVKDVNRKSDPYLIKCLREECTEVIWSNVLIDDQGTPHWVGNGEEAPLRGFNFQGPWWQGKLDDEGNKIPMSNPNARCTLDNRAIDNYCETLGEDPRGVPIKVITYSGRDSDTMPPVWVAKNSAHGVVLGASIVSKATATELGVSGVRRQPWANEPFIPGPLGDYMEAQFKFFNSSKFSVQGRPILAGLNYFLTHGARGGEGMELLGEKRDVKVWLGWLELMTHEEVGAIETPIGKLPLFEDLKTLFTTMLKKEYTRELYDKQFSLYIDNILSRIKLQKDAYQKEIKLPDLLFEIYNEQEAGLTSLKEKYGPVVTPAQLLEL